MSTQIFAVLALITAFIYMFLGLIAYRHQTKENNDKGRVLSPLWALSPYEYDAEGQAICKVGKVFFWVSMALSCAWLVLK